MLWRYENEFYGEFFEFLAVWFENISKSVEKGVFCLKLVVFWTQVDLKK